MSYKIQILCFIIYIFDHILETLPRIRMKFYKMHGLGNDFIIIQNPSSSISSKFIQKISDRKFGIGCDQLFILQDNIIKIYNCDGSEASLCINGIRCVALLLYRQNKQANVSLMLGKREIKCHVVNINDTMINTQNKLYDQCHYFNYQGSVRVEVGNYHVEKFVYKNKHENKKKAMNTNIDGLFVNIGNQHIIFLVNDLQNADMELAKELNSGNAIIEINHQNAYGENIEGIKNILLESGVNVSFVQVISSQEIRMRTYERGVGETLACGSGASAAYAGLYSIGLVDDMTDVYFSKGNLRLSMLQENASEALSQEKTLLKNNKIMLEGLATLVCEGYL